MTQPTTRNAFPSYCGATFELLNGETVTPCRLPAGHEGDHKGTCLGSPCTWGQGMTSEEEERKEDRQWQ